MSISPWLPGLTTIAVLLTLRLYWPRRGLLAGMAKVVLALILAFVVVVTWNAYDLAHVQQPAVVTQR